MFSRLYIIGCFAMLAIPLSGLTQASKTPVAPKSRSIPLAPCTAFDNPKSCKTFNDMLIAHDSDFSELQKTNAYICFRTSVDAFFRVNFKPFDKALYKNNPSKLPEIMKNSVISFDSYLDGQDNGSYILLLKWNWVKDMPYTAEANPYNDEHGQNGIQSLKITDTSIHLAVSFTNINDEKVTQTIDIRKATGRYSMNVLRAGQNEIEVGRCAIYPR